MERDEMNPCGRPGAAFNTYRFEKDELFPMLRDPTAAEIRTAKDLHERLKCSRRITSPVSRAPRRSHGMPRGVTRPLTSPTGFGRSRYVWIHNERHMLFDNPQHASEMFTPTSSDSEPPKNGSQRMLEKVGDALANVPILLGDHSRTYGYRLCDRRVDRAPWADSFPKDECEEVKKAMEWTPSRLVQPHRWNSHERTPHSNRHHDGASSHFISHFLDDPIEPELPRRSVPHRQMLREILITRSPSDLSTEMGHGLQCLRSNPFWSHGEISPPFWSGEGTSRGKRIHSLCSADLSRYADPILRDNPYYYPNERSLCGKVKHYKQKRDRNSVPYGKMHATRSLLQDYLLQSREKAIVTAFLTLLTTMPADEEHLCSRDSDADNPCRLDSVNTCSESLGNIEIKSLSPQRPSGVNTDLPASGYEHDGHVTETDASTLQVEGTNEMQPASKNATEVHNVRCSDVNVEFEQTKKMEHRGLEHGTHLSEVSHAVGQYISCLPWYESHLPMQAFCTLKQNNEVEEAETTRLQFGEGQWLGKVSTSCTLLQVPPTTAQQKKLDSTSNTYGSREENKGLWNISTSPTVRTEANRDPSSKTTPSLQTDLNIYNQTNDLFHRMKKKSRSEDSDSFVSSESFPKISQLSVIEEKEKARESLKCQSSKTTVEAYIRREDDFTIKETTAEIPSNFSVATGNQKESGDEAADSVRISLQEKLAINKINSVDGTRNRSSRKFQVLLSRSSTESVDSESSKESLSKSSKIETSTNESTWETSEKTNDQYQNVNLLKEKASLEDASRDARFRVRFNEEEYSNETITETSSSFDDSHLAESEPITTETESFNEMVNKAILKFQDLVTTSSTESLSETSSTGSSFDDNILKTTGVDEPIERVSRQDEFVGILNEKSSIFTRSYAPIVFKVPEQECLDKVAKQSSSGIQDELTINKDKSVDETSCETEPDVQDILNIDNKSPDLSHEVYNFCTTTSEDSLDESRKIINESMVEKANQENPQVQDELTKNKSTDISSKENPPVQNEFITRNKEPTDYVPNVDSVTECSSIVRDKQMSSTKVEAEDTVEDDSKHEALNELVWSKISHSWKTSSDTYKQPQFANKFYVEKEFVGNRSPHTVGPKILRKMRQLFRNSGQFPNRDDKKPGVRKTKSIQDTQTIFNASKFSRANRPAIYKRDKTSSSKDEVSNMTKEEFTEKPLKLVSSCKILSKVGESPGNPEQVFLDIKKELIASSSQFSMLPQVSGHIPQPSLDCERVTSRDSLFTMKDNQSMDEPSMSFTQLLQKIDSDEAVIYGATSSVSGHSYPHQDNLDKPVERDKCIQLQESKSLQVNFKDSSTKRRMFENKNKPTAAKSFVDESPLSNVKDTIQKWNSILCQDIDQPVLERNTRSTYFKRRFAKVCQMCREKKSFVTSKEKVLSKWPFYQEQQYVIDRDRGILDIHKQLKKIKDNSVGKSISKSMIFDGHKHQVHSDQRFRLRMPKAKSAKDKKHLYANKSCSDFNRRQSLEKLVSGKSVDSSVLDARSYSLSSQSLTQLKTMYTTFPYSSEATTECSEVFPMDRSQYLLATAGQPRCLSDINQISETWLSKMSQRKCYGSLEESSNDETDSSSQRCLTENDSDQLASKTQSAFVDSASASLGLPNENNLQTRVDPTGGDKQITSENIRPFDHDKNIVIQAVALFQPPPDDPPKDFLRKRVRSGLDKTEVDTHKSVYYDQPLPENFKNDGVKLSPSPLYGCCMAGEWMHLSQDASQEIDAETNAQKRSAGGTLMRSRRMSSSSGTDAASSPDSCRASSLQSDNFYEVDDGMSLRKSSTKCRQKSFEDVAKQPARWPQRDEEGEKEILTSKEGFYENKPPSSTGYSDSESFQSELSSANISSNWSRSSRTELTATSYYTTNEPSTTSEFASILALDKVIIDAERKFRNFFEESSAFNKKQDSEWFDPPLVVDMAESVRKDISEESNDSWQSLKTAASAKSTHTSRPFKTDIKEAGIVVPESEKSGSKSKPNESSCLFHTNVEKMKAILLETSRELRKLKKALLDRKLEDRITLLVCGICDSLSSAWLAEVSKLPTSRNLDSSSDSYDSSPECTFLAKNKETTKAVPSQLKTYDIFTHLDDYPSMNEGLRQRRKKCGLHPLYRGECESVADECLSSSSSLLVSSQSAHENHECLGDLYQRVVNLFATLQQELQKSVKEDTKGSTKSSQGTMAYTIKRKALKVVKTYSQNNWFIKQVLEKPVLYLCLDPSDHQHKKRTKLRVHQRHTPHFPLEISREQSTESSENYKGLGISPSSSAGSLVYKSANSSVALPFQNQSGGNCSAESNSDDFHSACNFIHTDVLDNTLDKFNSKMVTIKGKINHMLNLINRYNTSLSKELEAGGTQLYGNNGASDSAAGNENNMLLPGERENNTKVLHIPENKDEASKPFQFHCAQENLMDEYMLASILECHTNNIAVQSLTPINLERVQSSQPVIHCSSVIRDQYSLTELMKKHSPEVKPSLTKERIRFIAWKWKNRAIKRSGKVHTDKGRQCQSISVNKSFTSLQGGDNSVGMLDDNDKNSTVTRENRGKHFSSNIFAQTENAADGSLPRVFSTGQLLAAPPSTDFSESEVPESRPPLRRLLANKEENSFPSTEFVDLTTKVETAEVQSAPRRGDRNRVLHKSPPVKHKLPQNSSPLTENLVSYESTGTMKYGDCFVDVFQEHQVKIPLKSSARNLGSETQGEVPLRKDNFKQEHTAAEDNRNLLVKRKKPMNDTIPRCAYRSRRYLQQCYGSATHNDAKRLSISTSHPMMERPQVTCADRLKYSQTNLMKTKYLSGSRFRDASSRPSGKDVPIKCIQQVKSEHCKTELNRANSENLTRDLFKKGNKMVSKSKYLTSDKRQHKSVTLAGNMTCVSKKERKVFTNPKDLTTYLKEQTRVGLAENKTYLPSKESKTASQPKALISDLSTIEHKNISHSYLSMTHHTSATRLKYGPSDLLKKDNETSGYCQQATRNSEQKCASQLEHRKTREEKQGFFKQIFQKLRNRLPRPSLPSSEEIEVHGGKTLQEPYPLVFDKDFTRFGQSWPLPYRAVSGEMTSQHTWYAIAQPLMYSPPHSVSIHTHVSNRTSTISTPSPQHVYPVGLMDHAPSGKPSCRPEQKKESTQAMTHASQESIGFVPLRTADDVLNLTFNQSAINASRPEEEEEEEGEEDSPVEKSPRHGKPVTRRKDFSRRALRSQSPRAAGNVPKWRSVRSVSDNSPRVSRNNQSMKIRVSKKDEAAAQNITKGWREMKFLPWSSSEEACGKEELMLKFLQECSKWQNKRLNDDVTSRTAGENLENRQIKDSLNYRNELQSAKPHPLGKDDHKPLYYKQLVKYPDFRQSWMLRPANVKPRKPGSTQEMCFRTVSGHQTIYVRESEIRRVHSSEPNPHQSSHCDSKNRSLPERKLNTFTLLPEQEASRMMRNARVKNFMQMSNHSYLGQKRNLSEEGAREFYSFPEELPSTTKSKEFLAGRRHPDPRKHCDGSAATGDVTSGSRTSESYISSSPEVSAISEKTLHSCILKASLKGNKEFVHIKQRKGEEAEANISWPTGDPSNGFLVEDNSTNMNDNMPALSECLPDMKTVSSPRLRDSEGTECDKEHVISSLDEASAVYLSMCVVDKVRDPATGHSIFNVSGSGRGAKFTQVSGPSRSLGDFFDSVKRVETKRRHRHGSGSPPRRVREHELSPTSGYSSYTFSPVSDLQEESQNAIFSPDSFKSLPASSSSEDGDDDDNAVTVRNGVIGNRVWKTPSPPSRQVPGGRQKQRNFPDAENKNPTKSKLVPQVSNKNVKMFTQAYVFNCRNLGTDPVSQAPGFSKTPYDEGVVRDLAGITINKRSPKVSNRYLQHLEPMQSRYSGTSFPQQHRKTTKPDHRVGDPGVSIVTQASSSSTTLLTFCLGAASMEKTSAPLKPSNTYCSASVNDITSPTSIREGLMSFPGRLKNASRNITRSAGIISPVRQNLNTIKEETDLTNTGVEPPAAYKVSDSTKANDEFGASSSVLRGKTLDRNILLETPERPMTVAEKIAFFNQVIKTQAPTRDRSYVRFKDSKQKATETPYTVLSSSTSDPRNTTFCSSESNEGNKVGMLASQKPLNTDNEEHGTSSVGDHADTLDSVGHQRSTLRSFYSQLRALFTRTSLPRMQSSPRCSQLGKCLKDKRVSSVSDVLYTSAATSLSSAGFCGVASAPPGGITSLSSRTHGEIEPVADSCKMNEKSQMVLPSQAKLRNQLCDGSSDVTVGEAPCLKEVGLFPSSQKTSINDVDQRLSGKSTVSGEKTRHHQVLSHLRISANDLRLEQSPESRIARVLQWMQRSQESIWNPSREDDTARKETIQDYTEGPHRKPIKSNIYGRGKVASPENVLYKRYYDARSGHYHNLCTCKDTKIDGNVINGAHLKLESAGNTQSAGTRKKVRGHYKRFQRISGLGESSSLSNRHRSGDDGKQVVSMKTTGDDSKPSTGDTGEDLDPTTLISSNFLVFSSRDKPVLLVDQRRLRKRQTIIMTDGQRRKDVSKDTEKAFSDHAGLAHGDTNIPESLTRFDCKNYHHLRSRNTWYDCAEETNMNVSKNANTTERLPADVSRNNKSHPVNDDQQPSETIAGRNESCKHVRDGCRDKTAALASLALQEDDSSDTKKPASDRQHRQPNLRMYQNLDQTQLQGTCKAMLCKADGRTRVPSQDALDDHCWNESSVKISETHPRQDKTSSCSSVIRLGEGGDCTQLFGNRKTFSCVKKTSDIQVDKSSVDTANQEKNPRWSKKPKCVTSRAMVAKSPVSSTCSADAGKNFNECYRSSSSNLTNNHHNVTQTTASHEEPSERCNSSQSDQSPYISCWSDTSHSIHSESMISPVDATVSDVLHEQSLSEQIHGIVYWYVATFADGNKRPPSLQTKTAIERNLKENIRTTIHEYIMNIVTRATDSQKTSSLHRYIYTENNQPLGENIKRMAHRCIMETTDMAYREIVSETMSSLGKANTLDGSTRLASKSLIQNMKTLNEQSVSVIEKKLRRLLCQHVKEIISQVRSITTSASPARIDSTDQSLQARSLSWNLDTFSSTITKVNREKSDGKPEENSRPTPSCRKEIAGEEIPAAASNAIDNGTVAKNCKSVRRSNIGENESRDYKQDSVQTPGHLTLSKQHSAQTPHPQVSSHQHNARRSGQLLFTKQEISRNDSATAEIQFIKGQHLGLEATNGCLDGKMQTTITCDGRTQRPELKTSATEERRGESRERLNENQHWMRPRNLRINMVRDDGLRESSAFNMHHSRPQSQDINMRANSGSRQSAELGNDRSPSASSSCLTFMKATSTNVHVESQDGKINKLTTAEKENITTFRGDTVFGSRQSSEGRPGFDTRKTLETKQSTSVRPVQAVVRPEKAKCSHLFDNETNFTSIDEDNAETVGVDNYFQRYQRDACSLKLKAQDSIKSQPNTRYIAQDKSKPRDVVQDKSTNNEIKSPKVAPHAQESVTENVRCSTRHTQGTGRKSSTLTAKTGLKKRSSRHDKMSPPCQVPTKSLGYDKYDDLSIALPKQTPPVSSPVEEWDLGFPVRDARHYSPATTAKDSVTAPHLNLLLSLPCMGTSSRPALVFQTNKTTVPASSLAQTPLRNDSSSLGYNDSHTTFVAPVACPLSHIPDDVFSLGTGSERSKALKKQRNTNAGSGCANSSITSPQSFTVYSQTIEEEQVSPSFEVHVPICPHSTKVTAKGNIYSDCFNASVGASCKDKNQRQSSRSAFITEKDVFPACAVRGERTHEDDIFLSISCCSDSFEQSIGTTEMSLLDVKNIPKQQAAQERNCSRFNKQITPSLKDAVPGTTKRKSRNYKVDTILSPTVNTLTPTSKSYKFLPKVPRDREKGSSSLMSSSSTSTKVIKENEETLGKESNSAFTMQSKGKRLTESEEDVRERIAQARNILGTQEQLMVLNRKFEELLRQTLVSMRDAMFKEEERWKKARNRKAMKNQRQKKLIEESKKIAQTAMSEALQQLQIRLCSIEEEACAHINGEMWDKTTSNNSFLSLLKEHESNDTSVHTQNSNCSESKVTVYPRKKRSTICTCSRPRSSYGGRYDLSTTPPQPPRNNSSESFLSASIYSLFSKSHNHSNSYSYPPFKKVPTRQCPCSEGYSLKRPERTISGWSSSGCNISRHFNNNWNSTTSRRKRHVYRIYSELALNAKDDTKKCNVPYRLPHRGTRTVASRSKKSPKTRTVDHAKSAIQMSSRIGRLELSNDKGRNSSSRQKLMRIHNSFFKDLKKLAKKIAKDGAQSSKIYLPCMSDGGYLKNRSSKAKYLLSLGDVSRIAAAVSMTAADIGLTNKWKRLSSFILNTPSTLHHLNTDRYNSRRVAPKKRDFVANKNKSAGKYNPGTRPRQPKPVASSGTASFLSLTYCDSNEYVTGDSISGSDMTSTDYNSVLGSSAPSLCSTSQVSSTITVRGQFSSMQHHDAADTYAQSSSLSISIVGCSAQLRKNSRTPCGVQVNPGRTNLPLDKATRKPSSPRKLKLTIKHGSSADCKQHHQQKQQPQEQQQHPPGYFGYKCRSELDTDFHDGLSELAIHHSCCKHPRPQCQTSEARTRTLCYRLPYLHENGCRGDGLHSSDHNTSHIVSQRTDLDSSSTRRMLITMIKENMSGRGRLQHMSNSRHMSYGQMLISNSSVLRNMRLTKAFSESTLQSLYKDAVYQYYLQCQHRRHCRKECKGRK